MGEQAEPRGEPGPSAAGAFAEAYLWLSGLWFAAALVHVGSEVGGAVAASCAAVVPLAVLAARAGSVCARRKWLPAAGLVLLAGISGAAVAGSERVGHWALGLPFALLVVVTALSRTRWLGLALVAGAVAIAIVGAPFLALLLLVPWILVALRVQTALCGRESSPSCGVYALGLTLALAAVLVGGPIVAAHYLHAFAEPESYWLPLCFATAPLAAATLVAYGLADLAGRARA